MPSVPRPSASRLATAALGLAAGLAPAAASAHVKWFCAFDVAGQPRGLELVLCDSFELLVSLSLVGLLAGSLVEGSPVGRALLRALDAATAFPRRHSELLIRGTIGFFLVSLWNLGGILLTPELRTASPYVPWFELAMAAALLWRHTLPFTAFGIVVLYLTAVLSYGPFHLADYPIFLGLATYLALTGFGRRDLFGVRPLDLFRYATSITLMWASIEKWAYPEWSFPLIRLKPEMTMGFDPEFFMRAAGVVEFALAFALICTPLVRRVAGILLLFTFVSAIVGFGKVDAIGHSAIIAALIAFIADDAPRPVRVRNYVALPAAYAASLWLFLGLYYVAHEYIYNTTLVSPPVI